MKFKKLTAGIVAAVMAFTAVATPLGDNLPAVRESTSLTAGATTVTVTQKEIVDYVKSRVGGSYRKNYCLAFVADCFAHFGATFSSACCAKGYSDKFMKSTDKNIPLGADVFFSGGSVKCGNGHICGHIGIYVGNNKIVHASGGTIKETDMKYINMKYEGWGWHGNIIVNNSENLNATPSNIGSDFESVIRCTSTGKVLSAGSDNNVTAISYNGSNNQLWKFYKNSDNYYEIVNVGTGKRLDVDNAGTADGTNIQVWTDNDSSAQRWGVYGSQGSYLLKPKYSTSSVLDSGGGNNNVHLWTYASNIAAQKFTIEKMPSTWFSDVTAKNIKTNDARIALYANKPASAKATKYSIEVWQTNNSSNKKSYSFTPSGNYPNEGVESKQIYFDMIAEVGFTLSSATQYSYKITQYFTYLGASMSRTSGTYSFTTLASSSHTHSYGSWYTKTSATCTSGGTEERKCSCGATESRSTSALGHNYGSWSTVTSATCTSGGSEKRTCSRCSNSETRSTSALGHNFGSTYFEADHPHKYAHLCQRCGYKEFTGGNLDYYYLCATCTHLTKPEVTKITGDLVDNSEITIEWTASESDKLANYWLDVFDPDGQNVVDVSTGKINSYTFTPVKTGTYTIKTFAAPIGNKDGSGSVGAETTIEIGCNHNYSTEIVNPTYDNEGYTLHTCTKCGYSYKDNYTPALKLTELTGVKVKTQGTNSLTLAWDKNANAKGYIIEQYKGGKWTQIAKTNSNATVTYTVNGLKADTTYTFRIKGYVVSGTTEYSGEYTRLAAKTRIANVGTFKGSTVSDSAVKLDWSRNDKATGYVIEQYKGGKWTVLATTKNNTTLTFTVKGLAKGTTYSFRIKSFRKTGSTIEFSEYTAIKAATLLDGVSDFKVASTTGSWITLEWAKNGNATGYSIEQYKGGKWTVIATTKNNTTLKFTVKGLKNDTTYSFRIRAYKTAGGSNVYSDYVRIAGKTRIPNVTTFTGSAVSASAVKLDWSKNDKATGYVIEQYKGGKWTAIATTKNNTTLSFTVKGLAKGTTYSFRIKSFRKTGSTIEFSEYTAIKAATLLDGVSDFKVASTTGSWITLEWAKNGNATGYSIEQYKGGKWTVIATTKNNTTLKFTVKGLKNDTTYSFRIRAYKTAGGSNVYSDYVRIAGKTRIPNVATFKGSAVSASAVKLDWSKNDKATGYVIEQYKGGKWTALATTKNNTTLTFTVKGLAEGTAYSFRIKSFRKTGSATEFSEYTAIKAATLK